MAYIRSDKTAPESCVFCNLPHKSDETQVVARSKFVYVTLNLYPYNNGHVMVVPYDHIDTTEAMSPDALLDLMLTVNRTLAALRKLYGAQAFNMGANLGRAAGAGIAEHFHFHIVPRWHGDSNFMTVVGETRVIPDSLDNIYRDLKAVWQELYPAEGGS
jgi:ATP adenylyltransferase